jgi:Domain of unknown function (DUF1707)
MSDIGGLPAEPVRDEQLRVGDRERHEAVTALGDHFAVGRLDQQEFDERVQAAYAARTRVDLRRLFVDLPEPAPFRPTPQRTPAVASAPGGRPWRAPAFVFPLLPLLFVALIVVSVITGVPVFPLFFLWIWFGAGRWGGRGPRDWGSRRDWGGPGRYAGTRSW